ncbi:MAG: ATP-binding protein [Actinomycetota bacterium]|nr:ATP-binding protein [Actinomycetota bacterium]
MSLPIRARLTLWYVGLLAVVLLVLGGFLTLRLNAGLIRGVDESLATRAAQISLGLQHGCEGEFQDVSDASLVGLPQGESGAQLLGRDGAVLESTGDPAAEHSLLSPQLVADVLNGATLRTTVETGGDAEGFRLLAISLPASSCPGVIVVATSTDEVGRSVRELLVQLAIGGPVGLLVAGLGGWWLAGRALAPVARMTLEADTIGIERLDERIDVPTASDEIQRLAETLNAMLDRLERGVEDKRRFTADASHELRTPLAVMRAELDVSLRDADLSPSAREALESALEEVERMRSIVENLLMLARADDASMGLLRTPVDLAEVTATVAEKASTLARPKDVKLVTDGSSVTVRADRVRIEQVVMNLVSNAIRFSPQRGEVRLSTWARDGGGGCTVTDEGPGVSPDLGGRVFERFVRGDAARASDGGSGLGLAICREIVAAHDGRIWVDSRAGGGGSFSVWLPTEDPASNG